MKKLLATLAFLLAFTGFAEAQCNGVFQPGFVCGNPTGSPALPKQTTPSAFQGSAGGTNGQVQYNNSGALGGYTPSGDVTVNTSTGVETIQPGVVTNSKLATGAANTFKGSLNGSTTSDLALVTCSAIYQFSQWVGGSGWQCGISPILPSRAIAATLNLSAFTGITVQGYYTAADGGFMTMLKQGSQPFCANFADTASFQDTGSNWWDIAEQLEYNTRQFGAKVDFSTDDAAATQSAIYCAAKTFQAGQVTNTGANGKIVRLPAGLSNIGSTITVPQGVTVSGDGAFASTFNMTTGFPTNAHFFILGELFQQNDIALSQTSAGAGSLALNGARVRSGVAYTLYSHVVEICSATNNNTGATFTITGINGATGLSDTESLTGPNIGLCVFSTKFFTSVTSVTSNSSYSNITVGYQQIAEFAARLQDLQLFSNNTNAVQFSTFINCCGSSTAGTAGVSGNAMVYTNSIQHTGGIQRVRILAGNRSGTIFEFGTGGASLFTYEDVEIGFVGNCGGPCASNNPGAFFNYGGLLSPVNRLVIYNFSNFAGSVAVNITGGFMGFTNSHCENTPTCFDILSSSVNQGFITFLNIVGAPTVTDLIKIEGGAASNITYIAGVGSGGATHTVNNKGVFTTGNVIQWTLF